MRTLVDAQSMLLSTAILALPGLTVPMGLAPTGPTGVQLVAGRFEEERCLGAAEQIERRRGPSPCPDGSSRSPACGRPTWCGPSRGAA
jgi:amidase